MKKSILNLGKTLNKTQLKEIKGSYTFGFGKRCCEWCFNGHSSYCLDWVYDGESCPISAGC